MTGIHEFSFLQLKANRFVAKLVNIPDIHCVSRLAFDDFNSHGRSPRLIQRFLKWQVIEFAHNAFHLLFGKQATVCVYNNRFPLIYSAENTNSMNTFPRIFFRIVVLIEFTNEKKGFVLKITI